MRHTRKSNRELIIKLLKLFVDKKRLFKSGFCAFIKNMYREERITKNERSQLLKIIDENIPKNARRYFPYHFKSGDYYVRFEHLIKLIVKYSTPARKEK